MRWRNLFKNRGLGVNLIASFCFLMLAVYGWGLEWGELGSYLLAFLLMLACILTVAAGLGWLLNKFNRWREKDEDI